MMSVNYTLKGRMAALDEKFPPYKKPTRPCSGHRLLQPVTRTTNLKPQCHRGAYTPVRAAVGEALDTVELRLGFIGEFVADIGG